MRKPLLLVAFGLSAATPAWALDPYMWGIGPRVGTMVIPGAYPIKFPPKVTQDAEIDRVRNDIGLGVDGVYYINGHSRTALSGTVGLGKHYLDANLLFKYNWVTQTGAMDFLLGGGAGFGTATFKSDGLAKLNIPYYPLRAEASALVRDGTRGYQGTVFFQYNLPGNHFYTDAAGEDQPVGTSFYGTLGVEISVLFGDMTPPKPRRRDTGGA